MKKDEFVVDKRPTPFKELCDEHEISYKDISLASGVAYHNLSKYALSVCRPSEQTLAKLNEVCEPIFGRTLTLEDFGFQPVQEDVAMATDVETQNLASLPEAESKPAPAKKTTRKKGGRKRAKATDVETQNIASLPAQAPEPAPASVPANDIRYARLKIECADNGFLLRDDVGNCWVADVSPDDLGKEIGREIYGEIDEAEKAIMGTDEWKLGSMTIWGWSVVVAVKAITDPRELHEFKDREI
jgi:transcriptional regulator with XRE-family HTH domain